MAKIYLLSCCLLWTAISFPVYSIAYNDGYCVRANAYSYVGVKELGGNNKGFTDPELEGQLYKQGWRPGYAWCAFFVKVILAECDVENTISGWSPTAYNRKDVVFTDGRFYSSFSNGDVLVMTLSYGKFRNTARYKGIGHTGIVDRIGENSVRTIEGNTNEAGMRDSRSRDGVYIKIRPLSKNLHITRWKRA